jgi:pimeloyl-ACP methyl ester carboxylesterase
MREFVSLASATSARAGAGGMPCQGVYYTSQGSRPRVAFIASHYEVDFSEHYLADLMAGRGFGFLGWNTRYRGAGGYFLLEHALLDIGAGVRWLRESAGAEVVVLLGNSGGASLLGAYQSQAADPNIRPAHGMRLPDAVLDLPQGDLFVSLNAHPGRPEVLTAWLDPSVTDEGDPLSCDPQLDLFTREAPLGEEFVERYRKAQASRNERISSWCLDELELRQGSDRLFPVYRTWADPRFVDVSIDPSDRAPGCYAGEPRRANYGPFGLAGSNTLRTWLSMWSLEHSDCRGPKHLARVKLPALVIQSTADQGCFPSDAQAIFEALGSSRKRLELVPGDHYLTTPDGARDDAADMISAWVSDQVR